MSYLTVMNSADKEDGCDRSSVSLGAEESSSFDTITVKNENRILKSKLRQLQQDLQVEQDMVSSLRKKMIQSDRERLDSTSKSNDEISRLDSEVTKYRAQIEKGEATRQNLEFELTKVKRDLSQEKRSFNERENVMSEVNETIKRKVSELSMKVEQLMNELDMSKTRSNDEVTRLHRTIDDRDKLIQDIKSQHEHEVTDKHKLETALQQQEMSLQALEIRLREFEDNQIQHTDAMRKQMNDSELLREKEERLRKELEMSIQRVKTLEESIEAERAAHLESKFNSEIVQLRIRDLEGALELEKSAKAEALDNMERLHKQLRDVQVAFAEERQESTEAKSKLEKAEKEYAILSQKLSDELEEKKNIISKLSQQLELHQNNFTELKDELHKARKRQIYLEETYGGSMRELEMMNNMFPVDLQESRKKNISKKKDAKGPSPTIIIETLRQTLSNYRSKIDELSSQMEMFKGRSSRLEKELDTYKNQIWTKDKALQEAQLAVTRGSKHVRKLQNDGSSLEKQMQQQENDLKAMALELEKEKSEHKQLSDQMVKVATKYKSEEKIKHEYLHQLYQMLLTGRLLSQSKEGSTFANFSWTDLTVLVNEQISLLLNSLHHANEKVKHLEDSIDVKEQTIGQIQQVHDTMLSKIANAAEGQTASWQQQKAEMEEHYSQLLAEIHTRHKKTQSLADQAWEKVRSLGTIQNSLEAECAELKAYGDQYLTERNTLLSTCVLLIGALYPLMCRVRDLGQQRSLLVEQLGHFDRFKQHVSLLADSLSYVDTQPTSDIELLPKQSALLRFRKAAICVLAANRLVHFGLVSKAHTMFTTKNRLISNQPVQSCLTLDKPVPFQGLAIDYPLGKTESCRTLDNFLPWLQNTDIFSTTLSVMTELQEVVMAAQSEDGTLDTNSILNLAKNSFSKLMNQFMDYYNLLEPNQAQTLTKTSLIYLLNKGLTRILEAKDNSSSSMTIGASIKNSVLDFTKRLHKVEIERRDLKSELNKLRSDFGNLKQVSKENLNLQEEMNVVLQEKDRMVPREKLEQICHELDQALKREKRAQKLLRDQNQQLNELGSKFDQHAQSEREKEAILSGTVQGLTDIKEELRKQDTCVRQLQKQIVQLESENELLLKNIHDAENALHTAAKDRDILSTYIVNVENELENAKTKAALGGELDMSSLLSEFLLPKAVGKVGPDIVACRGLVSGFVGALKGFNTRIRSLQDEIIEHTQHINRLKQEFTDAYQRENDPQMRFRDIEMVEYANKPLQIIDRYPTKDKCIEEFLPLIEDEDSYAQPAHRNKTVEISIHTGPYTTPKMTRHNKSRMPHKQHYHPI